MSIHVYSQNTDSKAYQSYQGDGLLDIFAGLVIVCFGLFMLVDMAWMGPVFVAALLPAYQSAKESITAPRLTRADLSRLGSAHAKKVLAFAILAVLGILSLLLGILVFGLAESGKAPAWLAFSSRVDWLLFAAFIVSVMLGIPAVVMGARRYYGYAALAVAVFACVYWWNVGVPLAVIALGVFLALAGAALLIRFLHTHPKA